VTQFDNQSYKDPTQQSCFRSGIRCVLLQTIAYCIICNLTICFPLAVLEATPIFPI
jgi:hypothetical protein